ncbi:hypothetical protein ABZZ36_32305 [Actinacidiphila glaucinigra]|uniref:hypothetical protein n=1 Tax=Actinacidiphila glaucinigra TaxID=235986 RepID=UPI0033BC80AA
MTTTDDAPWAPVQGTTLTSTGAAFDAVCVPHHVALPTLHRIAGPALPVVVDPQQRSVAILVPPRAADDWDLPGVIVLGTAQYLALPPADKAVPPGPYWLPCPAGPLRLADPDRLKSALQTTYRALFGPQIPRCEHCQLAHARPDIHPDGHDHCRGVEVVRAPGAPSYEPAVVKTACGCACRASSS